MTVILRYCTLTAETEHLCLTLSLRIDPVTSSSLRCRLNLGGMLSSSCSSRSGSLFRREKEKERTAVRLGTAPKKKKSTKKKVIF